MTIHEKVSSNGQTRTQQARDSMTEYWKEEVRAMARQNSLRDYFATSAMIGLLQDREHTKPLWTLWTADLPEDKRLAKQMAKVAYLVADAMIAERNKA